ncbi:MAG: hypothetical protein ACFFCM_22485 [Promethearchaeota archaeon]
MTLITLRCPHCGEINVVNEELIDTQETDEKVYGFLGEKWEVLERDTTECWSCKKSLF